VSPLAPEALERYAECMVHAGVSLEPGDTLEIQTHPEHRELAVALAEAGYRAGAALVDVHYFDPRIRAARVRYGADEILGGVPEWELKRYRSQIDAKVALVGTTGEADPGVFDGLPPERVATDHQRSSARLKWMIKAALEGRIRWAGCAWPTAHWAGQVYPDLSPEEGQRRLGDDLLSFCRLGPEDPPGHEGWNTHAAALAERAQALTALGLERIRFHGPGTDLEVRLAPGTVFLGGRERDAYGHLCSPNIPTEEVFTSPQAGAAEGDFRCSRPLLFHGRLIDGIAGEFRGGRLAQLEAATDADRDFLAAFLDSEPNARRLGEIALVDSTSRIGKTDRVYFNTLIDENAAAHIAFGAGFGKTREAGRGRGVNRANMHLDVMIGSDDFEITGSRDGEVVPLIADGLWQL